MIWDWIWKEWRANMSDPHVDIRALMMGDLVDKQEESAREHIAMCGSCRAQVDSFENIENILRQIPPEALLEGPPPESDLLLQRTLRETRASPQRASSRPGRSGLQMMSAAAVLTLVAGISAGIGYTLSNSSGDAPPPQAEPAITNSPVAEVPGTRHASVLNAATGTRLTASVEPAAGFVRINAAVTGIPAGERCRLIIEGRDGGRETVGSWVVSEKGAREGATISGSTIIDPANVAAVIIENTEGKQFAVAKF